MNAYQKATILVTATLLPLLLLFMRAMDYAGIWIAAAAWIALASVLMYTLRNARTE